MNFRDATLDGEPMSVFLALAIAKGAFKDDELAPYMVQRTVRSVRVLRSNEQRQARSRL
jgi:hypothetical protein